MALCKLLGFRRLISHSCRLNRLLEALLSHPLDLQGFQNQLEWEVTYSEQAAHWELLEVILLV